MKIGVHRPVLHRPKARKAPAATPSPSRAATATPDRARTATPGRAATPPAESPPVERPQPGRYPGQRQREVTSSTWRRETKYYGLRTSIGIIFLAIILLIPGIAAFASGHYIVGWACTFAACIFASILVVRTVRVWWHKRQIDKAFRYVPPTRRRTRSSSYPRREKDPHNDLEEFSKRLVVSEERLETVQFSNIDEDADVASGLVLEQTQAELTVDSPSVTHTDRQAGSRH